MKGDIYIDGNQVATVENPDLGVFALQAIASVNSHIKNGLHGPATNASNVYSLLVHANEDRPAWGCSRSYRGEDGKPCIHVIYIALGE